MIDFLRIRRLIRILRFYKVFGETFTDSEMRDKIRILRIRTDRIQGVNYIHRALNPMDFMVGLDLSTYQDEKDKRRIEQDIKRMSKSEDLQKEKEAKFKEHALDVLGQALIYPDKERFPVADIYDNPVLFGELYSAILANSLGKKKIKQ
jgi:hypothetical protein